MTKEVNLKGTEKQVAWAKDLRNAVMVAYEIAKKEALVIANESRKEKIKSVANYIENEVLTQEEATYYIEHFKQVNVRKLRDLLAKETSNENEKVFKPVAVNEIISSVDFTQFTQDLKDKGYKFASPLRTLDSTLFNLEIIEKYLDELKERI